MTSLWPYFECFSLCRLHWHGLSFRVLQEWKLDTLCDLYETLTITQAVIFLNTRRKVDWLTEKMHARDFTVSALVRPALTDNTGCTSSTSILTGQFFVTAWRHGPEGAWCHYAGVQVWLQQSVDHYWPSGECLLHCLEVEDKTPKRLQLLRQSSSDQAAQTFGRSGLVLHNGFSPCRTLLLKSERH